MTPTPSAQSTQSTQSTVTLKAESEDIDHHHDDKGIETEEESNGVDFVVANLEELGDEVFGRGWMKKTSEDTVEKVDGVVVVKVEDSDDEEV